MTAEIHEKQGALKRATDCYAKVIQADPLMEQAYQRLMVLYDTRGMRNAALRTFEECSKTLQAELNTRPNATTRAIYKKILESG